MRSRRFSIPPDDTQQARRFLDDLNVFTSHGVLRTHNLSDALFGGFGPGYTADPLFPAEVAVPAFITPKDGRWVLLDAWVVNSTTAGVRLAGPYFKVSAQLRVGGQSRSIGAYSQRDNRLAAGVPFALRTDSLSLPADSVVETLVSAFGFPTLSLNSILVQYRILNVGD